MILEFRSFFGVESHNRFGEVKGGFQAESSCKSSRAHFDARSVFSPLVSDSVIVEQLAITEASMTLFLLDDDFNAYLSDFGLARLLGTSETHATTGVAGTFGYVAPEYAMTCRVSDKADVYSYGVVLLELLVETQSGFPEIEKLHEMGVRPGFDSDH